MTAEKDIAKNTTCTGTGHFSEWYALNESMVNSVLDPGPGAIQVRVAEGLVDYPHGKSAMVYFFFASNDARAALCEIFSDEMKEPGCRAQGPLWFRYLQGPEAQTSLESRWSEFVERFGSAPIWHSE